MAVFLAVRAGRMSPKAGSPGKPAKQTFYFHGTVQDVGFRSSVEIYACAAGLNCIKAENLNDGSVRVVLEGPENYHAVVLSVLKQKFKVSKITKA